MIRVTAVVEGYGDVEAVPALLSRLGQLIGHQVVASNPIRAGEWLRIKASNNLERLLELAHSRAPDRILIFLDLDDGCAKNEYQSIRNRIDKWINGRIIDVSIVFAVREYEAFFLWCAGDLGVADISVVPENPDLIRDAKGVIKRITGKRYKETQDQVLYTKLLDLSKLYKRSRSFKKLCKDVSKLTYRELDQLLA